MFPRVSAVWTGVFPAESSLPLPGATLHNPYQNPNALARLWSFYARLLAHASMAR